MSVHSHSAAQYEQAAPEFPKHVVTAVLVSHDGERWLPDALTGLVGQIRPVQDVIAADTGSADASARLIGESLGADRVLHLARRTGFGTAVDEAARTAPVLTPDQLPYLKRPSGWDPVSRTWRDDAYDMPELPYGEPVHWLWLLHDDCAPEPDALLELLRVADAGTPAGTVAIVGPKLRSWYNSRQLLEAGVSIANSGRRWTGLDRREQDQGQHDQVRQVLSVSTAGMLIRRDVFERLGGFDRRLPLMRDDVDLCWRAQAAGHQVLIAPGAVVRHAEAAARERRPIDCAGRTVVGPHRVDKAGAVYTLLANARARALPWVLLRLILGTLVRTLAYLVGKVPGQALDEVTGLSRTLLRPGLILSARRRRGKPAVDPGELRSLFPPPGATVRATVEQVASNLGGRSEPDLASGGRHGAVESGPGGDDADYLEVEQFVRLKRIARKPAPVLFMLLLLISLIACRALLGGGALAGGALLPAPADIAGLWSRYADIWHPVGIGGTESAPPYVGILAGFAAVFLGSTGLTLTLLLVCSVPLAGLSAYFASRPLVTSRLLRAWGSVAYAFLPAITGALASGRIGTAVLAILLPLMARAAVVAAGLRSGGKYKPGWRGVWAYALLLTITTAFTPIVWPIAAVLAVGVLVLRIRQSAYVSAYAVRTAVLLSTPMVLLAPWSLSLLTSPSGFLREAGLPYESGPASALDLLALTPGGPGSTGGLLLIALVLAALAALLRPERQLAIRSAWIVALTGLLFAALANGSGWAGPATLVYGLALLGAAVLGAEGARGRVAAQNFGWRQPVAVLIAGAAALAPAVAAVSWMISGAHGPLERRDPVQVPAFVAEEAGTRDQPRTLVLDGGSGSEVLYALVRGSGARLGDGDLAQAAGEDTRLGGVVANLVAGSGADQTSQLGGYGVRYVFVREGTPREMIRVLNATPGLERLSKQAGGELWRVGGDTEGTIARVTIVSPGVPAVPVAAGPVEVGTEIPVGPQNRILRIADAASDGWQATLNGRELEPVTVDGWAQGFELLPESGRLEVTYKTPVSHTGWIWAQGFLALVVLVLALPGRRRDHDDDLPETVAPATVPAQPVPGEGRRARRLRAAQEAQEGAVAGETAQSPGQGQGEQPPPPPEPPYVPEQPYGDWDTQQSQQQPQQPQQYAGPYDYGSGHGDYTGSHGNHGDYGDYGTQDGTTYDNRSQQ
ncbi:glycosyltransferase family 2 protein [Streptomyces gobiensis]|uniref:glycosyltransferase family 2 protein n=1 Tax=Streptomyces gobiensis TaxID=2875706 RepID=UPI001E5A0E32|nr:glycosyltransferase family 2 protein [Streptomyces gobiensis]UGY91762.1 glycosyltransferase family 2 protein [Streptomyces gobiensis]